MKKLKPILFLFFVLLTNLKAIGQTLTYTFIDPCTKEVTYFHVPVQGGTVIFFLGQQRSFTAADVASGDFANWTNQVYADYRKVSPCGVQQGQVTQNQITSQIIGGTVQSVVGSIMSQAKTESSIDVGGASSSGGGGGNDAAGKNNKSDEKKSTKTNNGTNNSNGGSSNSSQNQSGGQSQDNSGTNGSTGGSTGTQGDGNTTSGGGSTGSGNSSQGGGSSSQPTVGSGTAGGGGGTGTGSGSSTETKTEGQGSEVAGSTTMTVDAKNDKGSDNSSSGGGGGGSKKSGGNGNSRSNPIIVSSDLTNAQNLDKSYTGIINIGTSRSSLTGSSSWGITSMVWFNFKQAALTGRYTKIHFSKDHKLKLIHNINLTGVYSYGNFMGFLGYSAILNAGKWGVTGANVSGAITKTPDDHNLFISPSITAFYTKPIKVNKKLIMSPELYVISTPLIYSSVDKVSVTDRTFSAFVGTGVDWQITKRFKVNINYKANMSTNPSFPILSFFLIGSKINL